MKRPENLIFSSLKNNTPQQHCHKKTPIIPDSSRALQLVTKVQPIAHSFALQAHSVWSGRGSLPVPFLESCYSTTREQLGIPMTITWNTFADHFGGGAAMVFINLQDFLARVPRVNLRMLLQPVQPCKNVQAGSSRVNPPPVLSISRERLQKLQVVDCWLMVLENATPARGGLQQSWQPVSYPLSTCVWVSIKSCAHLFEAQSHYGTRMIMMAMRERTTFPPTPDARKLRRLMAVVTVENGFLQLIDAQPIN